LVLAAVLLGLPSRPPSSMNSRADLSAPELRAVEEALSLLLDLGLAWLVGQLNCVLSD
jgi:hypothetical protein